jgi:hypothetical protein
MIMQSPQPNAQNNDSKTVDVKADHSKPNEQGHILVQDHFAITDVTTKQILVKGRG